MRVEIKDRDALLAVSPAALSAYARTEGWEAQERYREHSDVYVGDDLPEIIVPRTARLGDYASVVARLIGTFAEVREQDQLTVYRSLVTADRDVVRVRAPESEEGSVSLQTGADIIGGARDMLLAAACSLREARQLYRARANQEAVELLKQVRLGQTEHGSFVVTLLTPVVPPPMPGLFDEQDDHHAPIQRRLTRRLIQALAAAREAVESATTGNGGDFESAVERGVSANLCEALVRLVEPFPSLDVGVSWARTRPANVPAATIRFGGSDAALLREAARVLRDRAPQPDVRLYGFVRLLKRSETEDDGTIALATKIERRRHSVQALLERRDYERAVQAHRDKAIVVLTGDLQRVGQRWTLLNPSLEDVIRYEGPEPSDA